MMGKFKINKYSSGYSGVEGNKTGAICALANQLRLQNYIKLLEIKDLDAVSARKVLDLIEELEEE